VTARTLLVFESLIRKRQRQGLFRLGGSFRLAKAGWLFQKRE